MWLYFKLFLKKNRAFFHEEAPLSFWLLFRESNMQICCCWARVCVSPHERIRLLLLLRPPSSPVQTPIHLGLPEKGKRGANHTSMAPLFFCPCGNHQAFVKKNLGDRGNITKNSNLVGEIRTRRIAPGQGRKRRRGVNEWNSQFFFYICLPLKPSANESKESISACFHALNTFLFYCFVWKQKVHLSWS